MGNRVDHFMEALRKAVAGLKRGFISDVQKDAGHSDGYLSRIFSGKRKAPDAETVFSILAHPQIDARQLLKAAGVDLAFSPEPSLARIPLQDRPDPLLERLENWVADPNPLPKRSTSNLVDELKSIDQLRFSYPGDASRELEKTLNEGKLTASSLDRALIAYGEDRRLRGKFGLAARALKLAWQISREPEVQADCLRRIGYLFSNQGFMRDAEAVTRRAVDISVRYCEQETVGRMLFAEATMIKRQGLVYEALGVYRSCYPYLGNCDWTRLCSLHHAVASCYVDLSAPEKAIEFLMAAENEHRTKSGINYLKIFWTRGCLFYEREYFPESESDLRRVLAGLIQEEHPDPIYLALVSLDLVKTLFRQGRLKEIDEISRTMLALVLPSSMNQVAAAAILEFFEICSNNTLNIEAVDRIGRKIAGSNQIVELPANSL